ncbi:MAG: histidine kinase, partial [Anaerolineaceae bacterium]|nr:histidine kinase [Anaerolineaceae bacterium]
MRKSDYPFLADWFAISLRWLVLLGMAYSLIITEFFSYFLAGVMLFSILWNLLITIVAILNQRMPRHRELNVVVDFLVTTSLFFFSGGVAGPLVWSGLLTLFSTAIYFEWLGSLLMAVVISCIQVGGSLISTGFDVSFGIMGLLVGFNLFSGGLFGFLSMQLYRRLRKNFQNLLHQRGESVTQLRVRERERMQVFYGMIETLSASLNYEEVLETSLDLSASALEGSGSQVEGMVSAVMLFGEMGLQMEAARGFSTSDMRRVLPAKGGILQEVIRRAEPKKLQKLSEDAELSSILALQECESLFCLPLNRGLDSYGVMLFAHPQENFFDINVCELLEIVSHQAVIAIQNARLFQDLEAEKERMINTQEEERRQLARDLHDGPTQSVAGIAMRVEYVRKLIELQRSEEEILGELKQVEDLARNITKEIRHMLFTLRPLVLENEGLIDALEAMALKMKDTYQQNVVIDADPEAVGLLDMSKHTVIFKLAEEAVNNARKHARADQIRVRIKFLPKNKDLVYLEIADNGVGFDVEKVNESYHQRGSLG